MHKLKKNTCLFSLMSLSKMCLLPKILSLGLKEEQIMLEIGKIENLPIYQ